MSKTCKSLAARGVDLSGIRNKNEYRVAAILENVLSESPDHAPDPLDVQDMYALALNLLPARYVQKGTIILREKVSIKDVEAAVLQAVETVRQRPNY